MTTARDNGDRWQLTDRRGELPAHRIVPKDADGGASVEWNGERWTVTPDGTLTVEILQGPQHVARQRAAVPKCEYLGDQRTTADGLPEMIKCNCGCKGNNIMQAVYDCGHPERIRPDGSPGRCTPMQRKQWDADHATEAAIYQPCLFCEYHPRHRKEPEPCTEES